MCACEPGFVCPRCAGTPLDDRYLELPDPRADDEHARYIALAEGYGRDDAARR